MRNHRNIFLILITFSLILTLSCVCATDLNKTQSDNPDTITTYDNTNQANIDTQKEIKQETQIKKEVNNKQIKKAQNTTIKSDVTGYNDLYNKIETIKNNKNPNQTTAELNLKRGNYNITKTINWGNTKGNIKTLKIYANNNLFDAQNKTQFITVENGYTLELYNFKIRYANATRGSVIYNNKGTINIYDSIFLNSTALKNGGVIYNDHGKIKLKNNSFSNNKAENGACIYNNQGTLNLTKTYASFNIAKRGGVLYNIHDTLIMNSTFKNNKATENGGVIYNERSAGTNIQYSNFYNNTALNYGGCIYNLGLSTEIYKSDMIGNKANNGGATANYGYTMLQQCNINQNTATRGGANYNLRSMDIGKTTLNQNKATLNGGWN